MKRKSNKTPRQIRVGIIGLGFMGQNHLRVFSQLPNTQLVAASDASHDVLLTLKKKYPINFYLDYKEMLKKEQLDAVSITVPTHLHYKVAMETIKLGVNLLIEKPIASSAVQARKIIRAVKEGNLILGVGHIERFNPAVTELKQRLAGKVGKVFQIMIRRIGPFPERVKDVGVMLDLATHDLDIIYYLTESKIKQASSESARIIHENHEDLAMSILKLENGTLALIVENWLSPTKIRDVIVNCEKGMFLADLISQDLYFYENNYSPSQWNTLNNFRGMVEGDMIRFSIPRNEPLKNELNAFVNSVRFRKPFLVDGMAGLKVVESAIMLRNKRRD